MSKRGQLTVFIIAGILVVILLGIGYYLMSREAAVPTEPVPEQIVSAADLSARINTYIQECLRINVAPVIWRMARQGATVEPRGEIYDTAHKQIDVWCVEQRAQYSSTNTDLACVNQARTRERVEERLAALVELELRPCLEQIRTALPGAEFETSPPQVRVTLNPLNIVVNLLYQGTVTFQESQTRFDEFVDTFEIPLGRLIQIATDITNAEARQGRFVTGDWVKANGNDIDIQKSNPYPHTIYNLSTSVAGFNESLLFSFAVQGRDTAGKDVRELISPNGCCVMPSLDCRSNIDEYTCTSEGGTYNDSASCTCGPVSEPVIQGCCEHPDNTCGLVVDKDDCDGVFHEGDLACDIPECVNLRCQEANYYYNSYFGYVKHGESWCTYDSITGFGTDFVGSRHYLHTCLNGLEYVEPCRDFREEICVGGFDAETGVSRAACKNNRWYDCAKQKKEYDCHDISKRDCNWLPKSGSKYAKIKCVPFVPAGFKYWEGENRPVCSAVNQNPIFDPGPRAQGYNTLHICARLGDCGNYRNWIGELTKKGYKHPMGKPKAGDYRSYTHPDVKAVAAVFDPQIYYGALYSLFRQEWEWVPEITLEEAFGEDVEGGVEIKSNMKRGAIKCKPWVAPDSSSTCDLCSVDPLRPCTEYRCKSLGRGCIWNDDLGAANCTSGGSIDKIGPKVKSITSFTQGITITGTTAYTVSPALPASTRFEFQVETDEEGECFATLMAQGTFPDVDVDFGIDINDIDALKAIAPYVIASALEIPIDNTFGRLHQGVVYTPPPEVVQEIKNFLGSTDFPPFYISCEDAVGNRGPDVTVQFSLSDEEVEDIVGPSVELAEFVTDEDDNTMFRLAASEPVQSCAMVVGGQSQPVPGCAHDPLEIPYAPWAELFTWPCEMQIAESPTEVSCIDLAGNAGEPKQVTNNA